MRERTVSKPLFSSCTHHLTAWGLMLAWILPSMAVAQDEPKAFELKTEGDYLLFTVDETEGMPIKAFIKMGQEITGKVFVYSDNDLQSAPDPKISFVGTKKMRKSNFFAFFQTMLYVKGFATLIRGDQDTEITEIVYMQGPKRAEIQAAARYVEPEDIEEYSAQTGVMILTSFQLQYIPAAQVVNTIRPFFMAGAGGGQTLNPGVVGNDNVVLQGYGPQVNAAYTMLKIVDTPPEALDQQIRVLRLEHASAEELEPVLNEILAEKNRLAAQNPAAGASGAPLASAAGMFKIVPHSTLNAILVSGTQEQILETQDLIARLDVPVELTGGDTHVIRLQNVLAKDLQETLTRFINEDIQAEQQAQQGQAAATQRRPRKTVIIAHEESNSLLVSGTVTKFAQVQRVIEQLDKRQDQVLIECAVVELSTESVARLGIELGLLDIVDDGDFTRPFGFTSFGLTTFQDTDDNGLPDTRLPDFENPLRGITGGIISNDDFAIPIVVNALAGDTQANILSLPSVVVNNNEEALVRTEERRPTQVTSQSNVSSQTGAGPERNAGITLNISPSISTNNYLRLNINLEVSRFLDTFDPTSVTAGRSTVRQIQTQVTLPSGHTMVLGGVIEDSVADSEDGIPYLKDIPLLGFLFRSASSDERKTNLYFFLTPHILREEDFSDLALQTFRKKLEASTYIGHRRMQIIDSKWREGQPETLDDAGATIEDLDKRGGFLIPIYERPGSDASQGTAPGRPDAQPDVAPEPAATKPDKAAEDKSARNKPETSSGKNEDA